LKTMQKLISGFIFVALFIALTGINGVFNWYYFELIFLNRKEGWKWWRKMRKIYW
jgi:hypothetical protein